LIAIMLPDRSRTASFQRLAKRGTSPDRECCFVMTEESRQPLTPEQRKARDAKRRADAEQAMREHEAAQKAFYENRDRLRALRLAREARTAD
jgi:hypothetical protein